MMRNPEGRRENVFMPQPGLRFAIWIDVQRQASGAVRIAEFTPLF
jgi:hypothetical protein